MTHLASVGGVDDGEHEVEQQQTAREEEEEEDEGQAAGAVAGQPDIGVVGGGEEDEEGREGGGEVSEGWLRVEQAGCDGSKEGEEKGNKDLQSGRKEHGSIH